VTAVGNATLTVTGTGANITGTLNTGTGNANVGNIGATTGVFTNISGTLTTAAQPNVTSVASPGVGFVVGGTANGGAYFGPGALTLNAQTGAAEGAQLTLAWPGSNNLSGQGNSTWNLDVGVANTFRIFWQNATGVTGNPLTLYTNTLSAFGGPVTISDNSTSDALRINQLGAGNAIVVEDSTNPDSTPFIVDAAGDVLIGAGAQPTSPVAGKLQLVGGSFATYNYGTSNLTWNWSGLKSRNATVDGQTILLDGDNMLTISAYGSDGNRFALGAQFIAEVDGTPTANGNSMPGAWNIRTTGSGNTQPTSRMYIDSTGNVGVGTITPANRLDVVGAGNFTGNVTAPFFIGNGSALTGITASGGTSIINGTSNVVVAASGNVTVGVSGTNNVLLANSAGVNVAGTLNATGNANVGNLGTSGNITAGYFFGNGSQLTGISGGGGSSISNGTSNVSIASANGNVNTSVGGTANVLQVTSSSVIVNGANGIIFPDSSQQTTAMITGKVLAISLGMAMP
jgi:hypothetical protein